MRRASSEAPPEEQEESPPPSVAGSGRDVRRFPDAGSRPGSRGGGVASAVGVELSLALPEAPPRLSDAAGPPWRAVMGATGEAGRCRAGALLLLLLLLPVVLPAWAERRRCGAAGCPESAAWAVRLRGPAEGLDRLADEVAREAGLVNAGRIGELRGHYLLAYRPPGPSRGAPAGLRRAAEAALARHGAVGWHAAQRPLKRSKRALRFNDPKFPQQWHLENRKSPGMDINVTGVWERNVTGRGVTVVVVDDGVEHTSQDIQPNYSPEGSYDLNSNDPDPMPHPDEEDGNHHGTRCAGEIAAASNNSFCAVGVAFGSRIAGIRVLDGPLTDSLEAVAFNKHYQINDIYSCSWGPDDDGKTVDGPHQLGKAALQHGVMAGRRGFGSIFVVASGNGGHHNDNCNYDGYANSIYTVTIGAVDEMGYKPFYAEECASMLAVTFSGGDKLMRSIATTDWDLQRGTGCTEGHTGTSAAAPLAAGLVALMLQVRPCLTWRDVQHIIVFTATQYEDHRAHWDTNQAGLSHSHQHGFGLLNAWRLVNAAKVWESVPYLASYVSPLLGEKRAIPMEPGHLEATWNVTEADLEPSGLKTLEHVAVTVSITHPRRGNLEIHLRCPSGTDSLVGTARSLDSDPTGFVDWTFSTVRCWGEEAQGSYRLTIRDVGDQTLRAGRLDQWQLTLYGSSWSPAQIRERRRLLEEAMSGRFLKEEFASPCPPGLRIPEQPPSTLTANTLKTLMLLGCFAVFWTFYSLLEGVLTCDRGPLGFPPRSRRAPKYPEGGALTEEDTQPLCKEAEPGARPASPGLRDLEEAWGPQDPHWGGQR
ncbi:proprotein convertase subtilisin/kexin type 7 [Erythrolamprus reginae]|uniref:proprotein convertase subtilisin/kexin type 7 n=1 Tax=Erythrolamprus reginae TaxID=121349 RepID=UPI00396CFBE4